MSATQSLRDRFLLLDLFSGLGITFRSLFKKKVTIQYPETRREPANRFRGMFRLDEPCSRRAYDIVFTTRFAYLRRTLVTQHGHEVIFVGSGGIFAYRDRRQADRNLHHEMRPLLCRLERAPPSRWGDQPKWLYDAKRLIKRLIGRQEQDLYDLAAWTVIQDSD